MINAVLIGSGNVAWHLAPALQQAGFRWVQVYSPTSAHASRMAERLGGSAAEVAFTCREDEIVPDADVYLFAVKDDAVESLSVRLAVRLAACGRPVSPASSGFPLALHVSGAIPLQILQRDWARCGVLYAFASFRRTAPCPDLLHTPFCIEASDPATLQLLHQTARQLSEKVVEMNSAQRMALHIGGVWVNNYVNLMYTAAADLFAEAGLDFSLLHPIIAQTTEKILQGNAPRNVQTGPARRGDLTTLRRHEDRLAATPEGRKYLALYRLLAEALQKGI